MDKPETLAAVRLDIWLWAARFYKTRALAKQAIEGGKVEVQGQGAKASRQLKGGEQLKLRRGEDLFEVQVMALSERRGPAPLAQALYAESEASREQRLRLAEERRAANAGYRAPAGKPDKRARRLIQALGDLDAL
ncbi:RNA-binding S4 domain-containing protein [Arenimonas sp.]|uniref:RNA-binding S4 domain-containing protein n=1 Tax=Arenimonas sp. TaxID=1872635 RepID=UPI002E349DB0|nr:RNA-binding S4 domain-containing protein [Arenimonas sp.]HEX4853894.1 RNA-binding S4 domain-containing protein [Arenimonas sp.]